MLLMLTAAAILLAVWKVATYEPYTHRIPLYERADGTRGSMDLGPNRAEISLLARNDRDGTIRREDGRGQAVANRTAKNESALVGAARWLDVVQIELAPTPDRLDIIEARIFDHATRELIPSVDSAFGWRVVEPDAVQVYGLGKELPRKLDVWLRLQSYPAGDAVAKLATAPGSQISLPSGTITLKDIRAGYWAYVPRRGLQTVTNDPGVGTTLVVQWDGKWQDMDYQIAAISKSGEKSHTDTFHFLRFSPAKTETRPIYVEMSLDDVAHFELRPFGGRHRFFFEEVTLPATSGGAFTNPPTVQVKIGGAETETKIAEFSPLDVRVGTQRGLWADGVASRGSQRFFTRQPGGATDVDSAFTLTFRTGVDVSPRFRFLVRGKEGFAGDSDLGGRGSLRSGSFGYNEYLTPLKEVEMVEVSIGQPKK
jgi:hypothetical protein